jgi:HPt (histidine-containing phosphotransfer) domain-containing protein
MEADVYESMTDAGEIYSCLGDDPDLEDIVEMFVQELPGRVAVLLSQLNASDWQGLRGTTHQLKGTAGSYGFEPLSRGAARAECALRNGEPEEQIRAAVNDLIDLCGHARCGKPA